MVTYDPVTHAPRSDATTVWDLIEDSKQVIRDEPLRLNMDDWRQASQRTTCGTQACWGGWLAALAGQTPDLNTETRALSIITGMPEQALVLYILSRRRTEEDHCLHRRVHNIFYTFPSAEPGSLAYIEAILTEVQRLQDDFEARFRATPVYRPAAEAVADPELVCV